jgi:ribose transport system permease protein
MSRASGAARRFRVTSVRSDVIPLAFLVASALAFVLIPLLGRGIVVGAFDVFNSLQQFAAFGLVALALGATMIIGEFDLSVVGSYGLGALAGVMLGQQNPFVGFAAAIAVGVIAGVVQGLLIVRLGLSSVPVTLGGLLIMQGLTLFISDSKNVPFQNITFGLLLDQPLFGVLSIRVAITLALCLVAALLLWGTAAGRLLRSVGGDRAASRSLGLPVGRVVVIVFVVSGALSALAGTLTSYALASAQTNVGIQPLIFAVTAALIGGVSLSGGRGTVLGITAAAIGLSLLQGLFQVLALPVYFSNLIMGLVLFVVAALQAPGLVRALRAERARRQSALLRRELLIQYPISN